MRVADPNPAPGMRWEIALPNGVPMAFRFIPHGKFRMGQRGGDTDEEPPHRVVIGDGFWLGEAPVTQAQFAAWKPDHENAFPNQPDHPAEQVTWDEAREYARWLTPRLPKKMREAGWTAVLPDEARWEYACRAGSETEYYSGDGAAALAEVGWFDDNSDQTTHPVGTKPANAWGLHDMHGNVCEWCEDAWDARAYRKRGDGWIARAWTVDDAAADVRYWSDEEEASRSPFRVLQGGASILTAWFCRSAFRIGNGPSVRFRGFGFRVCLARRPPAEDKKAAAEPAPGGVARRDDESKPDGVGGAKRAKPRVMTTNE